MTKQAITNATNEIAVQMASISSMRMVIGSPSNMNGRAVPGRNRWVNCVEKAKSLMSGTGMMCLRMISPMKAGRQKNGKCHQLGSCARLFATSRKIRQQISGKFDRSGLFRREYRCPPLRGNPVTLPPLSDHAGGSPDLRSHREPRAICVLGTPEFDNVFEGCDF